MTFSEIKTVLNVSRVPFDQPDAAYPEWRSHFDSRLRVQYVMDSDTFNMLAALPKEQRDSVSLFLNVEENVKGPKGDYTKYIMGQDNCDYLD